MLDRTIPFRYLTAAQRAALRADLTQQDFEPAQVLVRQGDPTDKRVFLLEDGTVEALDVTGAVPERLRVIEAGHYFGERAVLFDSVRSAEVRALEPVRAHTMTGERFLQLVHESAPFAQALGNILRDKQGVFLPFDRFRSELLRGVGQGSIDLERLLPLYWALEPALHPHATAVGTIDLNALMYAVRRLPENITRTLAFYLTETLPSLYSDPDRRFDRVPTDSRRRAVYEMIPGKSMVLIRDGLSDLMDLVTCLCLYATEARKIRRLIRDGGGLDALTDPILDPLSTVWPVDTESRLNEVALHHEDFRIEIHKELNNYNSAHAETWTGQIADGTRELMGCGPGDLPEDLPVHIISSNTHSVLNCLSPWLAQNADAILEWAEESEHPLATEAWHNRYDLVCALARDYLDEKRELGKMKAGVDGAAGILSLEWTAFTGIGVQLIDTARLPSGQVDPGIPDPTEAQRSLIVNIDYAFGEQAEHIIANLISLFGRNLASVSVLGKAGGLDGARGDVFVGTGFVEQSGDHYYPLPGTSGVDMDRLKSLLPDRSVREGNVLTVTGTLLQNRMMLLFNKHIWQCVGLEMEGSYYLRQIRKSVDSRVIGRDLTLRFLYYVSDLPLKHDANLSASMRSVEGVPPLYATTREVLSGILGG